MCTELHNGRSPTLDTTDRLSSASALAQLPLTPSAVDADCVCDLALPGREPVTSSEQEYTRKRVVTSIRFDLHQ